MRLKETIFLAVVFIFYMWTATAGTYSFQSQIYKNGTGFKNYFNYPNLLCDALLKGKLNLDIPIPGNLLKLKNPYDPVENRSVRGGGLQDLSYYKGGIYSYFGPAPIVALFMPFKIIAKKNLPCNFGVFFFSFGIFLWSFFLLRQIKKKYFQNLPEWLLDLSYVVFAFSNICPYLLRRPANYELVIASGVFFLLGAIYFIFSELESNTLNENKIMLIGVFLGFAVGSRTYLIIASLLILALLYINKVFKKEILSLIIKPFVVCVGVLLAYNFLRFDNPFINGNIYQLTFYQPELEITNIIGRFFTYLFDPLKIESYFPYVFIPDFHQIGLSINFLEKQVGAFVAAPFLLFLPAYVFYKKHIQENEKVIFYTKLIFFVGLVNLVTLSCWSYITMRYSAEFIPFFLITAIILLFSSYDFLKLRIGKALNVAIIIISTVSIFNGFAFSIIGPGAGLERQNPKEFTKLKSFFD